MNESLHYDSYLHILDEPYREVFLQSCHIRKLPKFSAKKKHGYESPITVQKSDYWKGLVMIMTKNCNIVRDLIPLYSDNTASDESRKVIEEHCRTCDKCNRML